MKQLFFVFLFCIFYTSILFGTSIFDGIIVTVGKQSLTKRELALSYKQLAQENLLKNIAAPNQGQRAMHLRDLIYELLFVTDANQNKIFVTLKEINAAIEKFKENNKFSEEDFAKLLVTLGMDLNYFQKQFRNKILSEKVIQSQIVQKINIGQQDIQERFQAQYQKQETFYYLQHIFKNNTSKQTKTELAIIRKLAIANKNFGEIAAKHSEDTATASNKGILPALRKKDMLLAMEQAVANLQEGEISPPTQIASGYHLFYLDRIESKQTGASLTEVEDKIYRELYAEEYKNSLQKYIQNLQNKYLVVVKDQSLKQILIDYAHFEF